MMRVRRSKIADLIKEDDALLRLLHIKVGILGRELKAHAA